MKICLIYRDLTHKDSGIGNYVRELYGHLVDNGDEVYLITTKFDGETKKGLHVFKYPIISKPDSIHQVLNIIKNTTAARYLDKKYNFDIINSHEACFFQNVITAHGCHRAWITRYNYLKNRHFTLRPTDWVVLLAEKHQYKKNNYKKIISISEGIKSELIKYYKIPSEDIIVIPNSVNTDKFKLNLQKRTETRNKLNITNNIVILYITTEFKRKGLEYLIKALPLIKNNSIKLFVIGRDDPRPYKKLAAKLGIYEKIVFTGFVSDIHEYYVASDIFVLPSLYEPIGLVLLEAMAYSLPVITSKIAGPAELIEGENKSILLNNPTDPKEIAEKINYIIENNLYERMGRNARKIVEKYSFNKITNKIIEVYQSLGEDYESKFR